MSPLIFPLKLLLLGVAYAGVVAAVIAAPRSFATIPPRAVIGAQYSLSLLLLPNALSFLICAIFLRHRWGRLRSTQILAAGFTAAITAVALTFVLAALLAPLVDGSSAIAKLSGRSLVLLPGILAAQLLWFGKPRNAGDLAA